MDFAWILCVFSMYGVVILHHNIYSSLKYTVWYEFISSDYKILHLFCQCQALSICLLVHAFRLHPLLFTHPILHLRPHAICAFPSAPTLLTHLHASLGLHPNSVAFLLASMPVPTHARNCSYWRLVHLPRQPPQITDHHVSRKHYKKIF